MAQIDSGEWPRANERALRPDQRWEWRGGAKSRERPELSGHTMKHISGTLQDCAATRGRRFTVETGPDSAIHGSFDLRRDSPVSAGELSSLRTLLTAPLMLSRQDTLTRGAKAVNTKHEETRQDSFDCRCSTMRPPVDSVLHLLPTPVSAQGQL